jgi:GNAT superfamily N-acetyltransferase
MKEEEFQLITPADAENYHDFVDPLANASWPEFMLHDPIAAEYWFNLFERFGEYQFALVDIKNGRAAAMGNSLPFHWDKPLEELPEGGWDWVFVQAVKDHKAKITPNIQSAIQVAIHPDYQSKGLSARMINHMRDIGKSKGFQYLVAPVRPNQKSKYPLTTIDDYITWKNEEDLPFDPWLRVHARAGAKIIKPCHESMIISARREDWENWTQMKFPQSGRYHIPGALNPIEINVEKNEGIYIEPNVWMAHKIG